MINIIVIKPEFLNYANQVSDIFNIYYENVNLDTDYNSSLNKRLRLSDSNMQIFIGSNEVNNNTICIRRNGLVINSSLPFVEIQHFIENLFND